MTRINVGVEPKELPDRLLMAEHREIKRIPNCMKSGRFKLSKIPDRFTLGTGHVSFFYNKILYLKKRYQKIYQECLKRGFNVTNFSESFEDIDEYFMNDYQETPRDRELLFQRFSEKGFVYAPINLRKTM